MSTFLLLGSLKLLLLITTTFQLVTYYSRHGLRPGPLFYMLVYVHLAHGGLLLPHAHNDNAVSLADAALGPGCEAGVGLVEHDAMNVFLLPEPAGKTVLVDTSETRDARQPFSAQLLTREAF